MALRHYGIHAISKNIGTRQLYNVLLLSREDLVEFLTTNYKESGNSQGKTGSRLAGGRGGGMLEEGESVREKTIAHCGYHVITNIQNFLVPFLTGICAKKVKNLTPFKLSKTLRKKFIWCNLKKLTFICFCMYSM